MPAFDTDQHPNDSSSERQLVSRSGLEVWLLVLVVCGCLALVALAVWKYGSDPRSGIGGTPVGTQALADGTSLVLEQVTSKAPHEMILRLPGTPGSATGSWLSRKGPENERRFTVHPPDSAVVLWMTHWNTETNTSLDFDWWLVNVLTDEHGEELEDDGEQRTAISANSMASMSGGRPWSPGARTPGDIVIATSRFPMLRQAAGRRPVSVYDKDRKRVAEFTVTFPDQSGAPVWSPDSLPATNASDDVQVTFTGVAIRELPVVRYKDLNLPHRRRRWSVVPEFQVERGGQAAPQWKPEPIHLADALGNGAWNTDCQLSTHEPAWKVELTLARTVPGDFAAAEQWESPLVPLPSDDSSERINQGGTVGDVAVTLMLAGQGASHYDIATSTATSHQRPASTRVIDGKSFSVSNSSTSRNGGPTVHTVDIGGDCAHLVVKLENLPPDHRELFQVRDDQGRILPHQADTLTLGDTLYVFLFVAPAANATSLRVTAYVHTARTFELLVRPPE
jgi:hypothetical protein